MKGRRGAAFDRNRGDPVRNLAGSRTGRATRRRSAAGRCGDRGDEPLSGLSDVRRSCQRGPYVGTAKLPISQCGGCNLEDRSARRPPGSRETAAMVVGFALLILAGLAAVVAALASADADAWAVHSAEVRRAEARLSRLIQEAETGQRGYLLTGDLTYLDPFTTARRELPAAEAELRYLTGDNAEQQARLDQLRPIIGEKVAELARTTERIQAGDQAGALTIVRTNAGRDLMRRIRTAIAEFDRAEIELQATRAERAAFRRSILAAVIVTALCLAAALAWLVIRTDRHRARELRSVNDALRHEILQREQAEAQLHAQRPRQQWDA